MKDVMIDVESFGNTRNALPSQLGGIYFDRKTGALGGEFKVNIDARDAEKHGCEFDADTVYWWMSQSREALNSIIEAPLSTLSDAFIRFKEFLGNADYIWSHSTYDFVLVEDVLRRLHIKQLPYKKSRDIRTLMDLSGVRPKDFEREGLHHDALEDCKFQVKYCVAAFNALKE